MNPSAIDGLNRWLGKKVSLEDELLPDFISSGGALYGMECLSKFIDIGVPEDYYRSAKIFNNGWNIYIIKESWKLEMKMKLW